MAPAIVNSSSAMNGDSNKKPSVTISAAGATGHLPNGGPVTPSARPNINFGSLNEGVSSAGDSNAPQSQNSSLPTPAGNPRITSPTTSPSPIPQPAATSGGKPPAHLQNQGNGLSFGSIGGPEQAPGRMPSGQLAAQQLRRDGSQQSHGEMGNSPMNRGGYGPGGGRGGRGYQQGFNNQPSFSPGQSFRPMMNQQRPGSNYGQHFQGQMPPHAGSPHAAARTPNFQHSQPGTPQMQMGLMASQHNPYAPPFNAYSQHLGPQPGQFGMQPQFDPNYGYYQAPYQMHPQYLQQQAPPQSPRQFKPTPGGAPQQFVPGQYNAGPSQNMSRSSSQISERPASVQPSQPQPTPTPSTLAPPTTNQPSAAPTTPSPSNFTIPSRAKKSAAIVIKNADGEVVTFDKKPSPATSAPIAKSPSPAPATAVVPTFTPPSRPSSSSDTKVAKTAAEIKAEFQEQVKKGQDEEKRLKEEEDSKAAKTKEDEESASKAKEEADASAAAKAQEEEAAKVAKAKEDADAATAAAAAAEKEKADAEAKAEAEAKAAEEANVAGEAKAVEEAKAAEEAKAVEEAKAKAAEEAKAKEAADVQAAKDQEAKDKATAEADKAKADSDKTELDAAEKKRLEDEEFERMIAEMEAKEKADDEREAKYQAEKAAKAAAKPKTDDEEMRRMEREAEAAEEAKASQKPEDEETEEVKAEREKLFASLKKPTLGPGADESGATTPTAEESDPTPAPQSTTAKAKPAPLKLDVSKSVEPAQATPGMQSLKSARFLELQKETVSYPEGILSPNPALNQTGKRNGRLYDKTFLLQFQEAFKEKPSVDWDQKLKDTVHDSADSAGPKSARGGLGSRAPSSRGPPQGSFVPMGSIGAGGRTLPPGTTSEIRFQASQRGGATMSNPLAGYAPRGGAFPMGGATMTRQGSLQPMGNHNNSPRAGTSQRGRASNRGRDDRAPSRKEQEQQNKSMPLTAGSDLKPLEPSKTGWKPMSITAPHAAVAPDGHMAPDMVQRKVKSNLNKMTPERFEKIADQVLAIAAQSKDETDGRTLRQVIALTFEKACDEAHWASMYAKFCKRMLEEMSPEIKDENVRDKAGVPVVGGPLFRKYLLNRCQEEFERGWDIHLAEQTESTDANGEAAMLSEEYYVAAAAKRKGLGLVQFIGELYKLGMLSIKIMHGCVIKLLDFEGLPQESTVESLVKLLRAVGGTMQAAEGGPSIVNTYFERIDRVMSLSALPSRLHFMLLDLVDLRRNGWRSKDDQKGPKTITQIHEEAAVAQQAADAERARTSQRGGHGGGRPPAGRGDARFGGGPMAPPDYPRNQVGSDDLKRLGLKASSRQASSAGGPSTRLGPTSMFASRTASGRTGLGPPGAMMNKDDAGSRTNSQRGGKKEEEEPKTNANAFRYAFPSLHTLVTFD